MSSEKKSPHLTYEMRLIMEGMFKASASRQSIAAFFHCSESKISREYRRGLVDQLNGETFETYKRYSAEKAQQDADYKKTAKGAPIKIGHDHKLAKHIEQRILENRYSPYAIVQEIEQDTSLQFETTLSISTIYNYVGGAVFAKVRARHLLRAKPRKKHTEQRRAYSNVLRPCITARTTARDLFGHWEMDTVIGKSKGENNVLLVLTERKTRYEIIMKIECKKAKYVVNALGKLKRTYGKRFKQIFKTIAVDNGTEFSDYDGMSKYAPIYYCHPYSSWERGSNENANAIIRRWIPKSADMNAVSHKKVKEVENWMNNYPRKIIGTTSQKAFDEELSKIF